MDGTKGSCRVSGNAFKCQIAERVSISHPPRDDVLSAAVREATSAQK